MTKRMQRVNILKERVLFQLTAFQKSIELALGDPLGARSVSVFGKEEIIVRS